MFDEGNLGLGPSVSSDSKYCKVSQGHISRQIIQFPHLENPEKMNQRGGMILIF